MIGLIENPNSPESRAVSMISTPMRPTAAIAIRYTLFALIAGGANLACQWIGLRIYSGAWSLTVAMAVGTGAGLVTKYLLDKRWIFNDRTGGLDVHIRKFSLYTLMGVATTAIFWGCELLGDALTPDGRLRFVGATVGLVIGYVMKYRLDRRFVFEATS